jgi:tRNA 2-thiouridine synthesizing protein E
MIFDGKEIETDSEGYLKDTTLWSEALASAIAENEGITLAEEHWEVVRFVREFYLEFNTSPAIRMLVKAMANKLAKRKATAAICIACSRKDPPNRRPKSPACWPVKCI